MARRKHAPLVLFTGLVAVALAPCGAKAESSAATTTTIWQGLTPEEIVAELEEIEEIELGEQTATEVGGFPARRIDMAAPLRAYLWTTTIGSGGDIYRGWEIQEGPFEIIIVETPPGTLFITIQSPANEWESSGSSLRKSRPEFPFPTWAESRKVSRERGG